MAYETLKLEREGPLLTVRLNRPRKRNAISHQMHLELQGVFHELAGDFQTRVVILAGEGSAFSSGADTSEWGKPGPDSELELRHLTSMGSRTSAALESLDQVTIAAVHGFAVGGAVVLALCCDLRVAGRSTWFSIPEVELGIPFTWNALPRLSREVGPSRALELTVTCDRFSAEQAYEYGILSRVTADGDEMTVARELAQRIIGMPPLPVVLTKATMRAIKHGSEMGDAVYSDPDLLLYARLLQQRGARRSRADGASRA
jgi:enoyl-CoA hydratase/carnithine racemase